MAYFAAQLPYTRQSGELVVELNKTTKPPPAPYELLQTGALDEDTFSNRMITLHKHLMRYSWSRGERIYVFLAAAISFIVPWPLMLLADDTYGHIDTSQNLTDAFGNIILTDAQVNKLEDARLITFGIIAGLLLLLWGPYGLFKTLGTRRRRALLASWTNSDCAPPRPQTQHLGWSIRSSSTFYGRAQVVVNLPVHAWGAPSNFHPQAYTQEWLAPPEKEAYEYDAPEGPPPDVAGRNGEKV